MEAILKELLELERLMIKFELFSSGDEIDLQLSRVRRSLSQVAMDRQKSLMREIQSHGLNVIQCNSCETTLLCGSGDKNVLCTGCGSSLDPEECSDLY